VLDDRRPPGGAADARRPGRTTQVAHEAALLSAALAAANAGSALGPREREVGARPGEADVEQAALLGEGGVIVERVPDGQAALSSIAGDGVPPISSPGGRSAG
jgi:hypothetical protein